MAKPHLPEHPDETEQYYHIRDADNCVRVVIRNGYAFDARHDLLRTRLEIRRETGPDTMEWVTVRGTVSPLMCRAEAEAQAAAIYHGGWRALVVAASESERRDVEARYRFARRYRG